MLESDDDSVCVAAGEALTVIFDRDNIDKFTDKVIENLNTNNSTPITYSEKKKLIKETILKQIEKVSEARSGGTMFCNAAKDDWDVFKYFKEGQYPQTFQRIKGHKLEISSWSSVIQVKKFGQIYKFIFEIVGVDNLFMSFLKFFVNLRHCKAIITSVLFSTKLKSFKMIVRK
jgi:hypothetical protein